MIPISNHYMRGATCALYTALSNNGTKNNKIHLTAHKEESEGLWGGRVWNYLVDSEIVSHSTWTESYKHLSLVYMGLHSLYRFTGSQVYSFRFTGSQVYRFTGLQVYRFAGLQVYRFTGLQVYRFTSLQVYRFTGLQVYRFTGLQVCMFTGLQVLRFTGLLVYRFACLQVYRFIGL